ARRECVGWGPAGPRRSKPPTSSRRLSEPVRTRWSASPSPCSSVKNEHGLARKPPGHQVLSDLADLLPRTLQADMRHELTRRHELGEPLETDRCRLVAELGEEIEAVERRAPGHEELARVEGGLGRRRDAERDADTGALEGRERRPERLATDRFDDQVVLWRARDLVTDDDIVRSERTYPRHLVGAPHARGDVSAAEARQLDGEIADAAGGARHQHAPYADRAASAERQECREPGDGKGRSLRERDFVGQRRQGVLRHGDSLRPGTLRQKSDDAGT